MKNILGVLILAVLVLLASPYAMRALVNGQLVNYATDGFGILPATNLPTFGVPVDLVSGTTYPIACGTSLANTDNLHLKTFTNSGAIAVSIFQAGATGCSYAPNFAVAGFSLSGAGTITITPATSTIGKNGGAQGATTTITGGNSFRIFTDVVSSGCTVNGCWDLLEP